MSAIQELERGYHHLPIPIRSAETVPSLLTREQVKVSPTQIEVAPNLVGKSKLTDTGFEPHLEIPRFYSDINRYLAQGGTLAEAVGSSLEEMIINMRTHYREFTISSTVIPHRNRFSHIDGIKRIVGNNGLPVIDAISGYERYGSVLEASKHIDQTLPDAPINTVNVLMSSVGWSGFVEPHLNTETMIFWKDKQGLLRGLTLVTDLTINQAVEVMKDLGVDENLLKGETEKERLASIVRNPAKLSYPGSDQTPFEYVFEKILAQRGRQAIRLLQKDGNEEIRSVEQTFEDIKRYEELLTFTPEEEGYIEDFKKFVLERAQLIDDWNIQEEIVKKMDWVVLSLARKHINEVKNAYQPISTSFYQREGITKIENPILENQDDNFDEEIAYLQNKAGCPTNSRFLTSLGGVSLGTELIGISIPSSVTAAELADKDFCIRCGACGKYIWCVVRKGGACPKCQSVRECT